MNAVEFEKIIPGGFFLDDSYIYDDLFFLPKKTIIKDYHVEVLKNWGIEKLFSNGDYYATGVPKYKEEIKELDTLFENNDNAITLENENDDSLPLSPDTIKNDTVSRNDSYKEVYKRWILATVSFFNSVITTKDVNKQHVINLLNDIESFVKRDKDSVLLLVGQNLEGLSRVYRQTLDTVILGLIMSHSLQLSEFAKTNLVLGTFFHDIGMLKIPKSILEKQGVLTPEEIKVIQSHTIIGFNLIRDVRYSAIIASGALQHHERIDGTGYPEKKSAEQITNIGKIVAVLDAYSAAISTKSFRSPVHAKEAVQDLLKLGGAAYDTVILKEFVKNISIYPIGSLILLSNNSPAKVIGNSGVAMRPIVAALIDGKEETIDLSKRIDIYIKGVYVKK
ncbi:MAG: hypothetical protein A2015_12025 [Spirochaetes bacterium GWF1_31_7]|nr:MAG: hypothetical protein A2Y30_15050 [Spirochaetes bacterium GWE1_32_154]OHD49144.1 MAG: hypothetical protein A2015_12025 [Spirochaetes bacterium GWF1_31_7]OHD50271.1 MAG: hypothetical protein A2Y29_13100 [Spirochaetes bacterium GWE2_31_10]OHD76591.1 MAG: hypothetical protein A2355_13455 [Spirochaetes bacterium RIFOXYB1_FULL_32_8]HBD93945.1 hypothetical protein [Spirochaetia bacterium]